MLLYRYTSLWPKLSPRLAPALRLVLLVGLGATGPWESGLVSVGGFADEEPCESALGLTCGLILEPALGLSCSFLELEFPARSFLELVDLFLDFLTCRDSSVV